MAESALSGVFVEYTLTYQVETGATTTDAYGNEIPVTEDRELVINFRPYQFPQLVFAEGADPKTVRGKGVCINPSAMPAEVGVGSEFAMTYAGEAGVLQITQVGTRALPGLDDILGQTFVGTWRPT